ncbi:hypothetical protein Q8A67_007297 [Cirrhinus molitorella]|uniref:UPAR/Ly6 domain-containing protein n=1 Tax=Cirrhinus molitorella TaxID=172907 RepID=A0AA88Q0A3_9TELE|nr:hypothetical protein Q8A67_007297 [Cirrhinus molitorella]
MHLRVSTVVLFILLTKGFSLTCYECQPGTEQETESKKCAVSPDCKSWSIGTGCWIREHVNKCCDTDFCNGDSGSLSQNPNGKRCYTCDEDDCSKTLSCWGNEDYCFTAYEFSSHQTVATKGCASKSACDQEPGEILGFNGNITCCEGNLCNLPQSGTQSFTDNSIKCPPQSFSDDRIKSIPVIGPVTCLVITSADVTILPLPIPKDPPT